MKKYRNPPIYQEISILFKQYFKAHSNLPKLFRVTVGEKILDELSSCMKLIVLANFKKNTPEDYIEAKTNVKLLRASVEVLKSYFYMAWDLRVISNGFFADISSRLESISRQSAKWEMWFSDKVR